MRRRTVAGGAHARAAAAPEPASFAGRNAAAAWRRRYLEWMEGSLPRTSTDLFTRLPLADAVTLAAVVGTQRMTWPEVNAALGAMVKRAAADALDGHRPARHASPNDDAAAKQAVEDEIWARYHAQCDEVFAAEPVPAEASPCSTEQVWRTERILDRLRSARDLELAAVRRRLGVQLSGPPASEIRLKQSRTATRWMDLSPAERAALDKLDATGFIRSEGMSAALDKLVGEIVGDLNRNT